VLEVNAPVIDHPGSAKARLDRLLMVEPLRRWRERQCRMADLFITPMAAILPASVPRGRIIEAEWGVDTDRFRPDIAEAAPFLRASGDVVVVFAGAFRAWHGAIHLVKAIEALRRRGRRHIRAVFAGTGPEQARVRAAAGALDGLTFLGPLPHEQMPACLAAADIGAAPFDVSAHPPLSLGFYWSPLKVFEYMASGLPVVAPRIGRLERILSGGDLGTGPAGMADVGTAGVLYDADGPTALAGAIEQLADDPARRAALGRAARARAVHEFSWDAHCRILEDAFQRAGRRRVGGHTCVS
jgi:glycosyltransferase involved in cell wall biosynthesis